MQGVSAPAGWYASTVQPGMQQYWDGIRWTEHFSPVPNVVVLRTPHRTSHAFHLIMTLVTLGLWLPVWIIVAIVNALRK